MCDPATLRHVLRLKNNFAQQSWKLGWHAERFFGEPALLPCNALQPDAAASPSLTICDSQVAEPSILNVGEATHGERHRSQGPHGRRHRRGAGLRQGDHRALRQVRARGSRSGTTTSRWRRRPPRRWASRSTAIACDVADPAAVAKACEATLERARPHRHPRQQRRHRRRQRQDLGDRRRGVAQGDAHQPRRPLHLLARRGAAA